MYGGNMNWEYDREAELREVQDEHDEEMRQEGRDECEAEIVRLHNARWGLLLRHLRLARRDFLRRAITTTDPVESRRLLGWCDWCAALCERMGP